jgi:hypothetical protein
VTRTLTGGNSQALDVRQNEFDITASQATCALSFINWITGRAQRLRLILRQNAGGQAFTFSGVTMKYPGGVAYTASAGAGAIDILDIEKSKTDEWFCNFNKGYA